MELTQIVRKTWLIDLLFNACLQEVVLKFSSINNFKIIRVDLSLVCSV